MDAVDRISLASGSAHGVTTSLSAVPSSGQDNVAAGGMSRSALGGDASVGRGLVWTGKACSVAAVWERREIVGRLGAGT